jgi:hypothetical protein
MFLIAQVHERSKGTEGWSRGWVIPETRLGRIQSDLPGARNDLPGVRNREPAFLDQPLDGCCHAVEVDGRGRVQKSVSVLTAIVAGDAHVIPPFKRRCAGVRAPSCDADDDPQERTSGPPRL